MSAGWLTVVIVVVFVGGPLVAAFTGGAHRAGVAAGDGGRVDSAAVEDASAATCTRIPPVRETSVDDVLLNDIIDRFQRGGEHDRAE